MLKKKLEAVLFASNKPLGLEELGKLCKESDLELVKKSVNELKEDHESRGSSLVIMNNHGYYHVVVHENFIPYVKKLVTKTELSKTIIETLAIVAHKAPAIQSDVVKIRTNKAYDHLRELEELGYITRERKGRSKLIKLTPQFFEYFSIDPTNLKERFDKVPDMPSLEPIEAEGMEVYDKHGPQEVSADALGDELESYGHKRGKKPKTEEAEAKPGKGEETEEQKAARAEIEAEKAQEKTLKDEVEEARSKARKRRLSGKGMYEGKVPEKIKDKVDSKVDDIMGIVKEETDEEEEETSKEE
ncbi:MAG: SMC-Scp complex subunit ScpB [Candidatus Woesearchaeota archaeon]|jgi:segregation and condensation protein B|nr:SMC-Scp complex subunit ScpB [Candidatus Woesearchaeota archaeon]MDP7181729.1 SMC-Scp complex subunit ScpB [Candidatus Woesearchaeota archaeon]MDP7198818.1 SMC-Scp complex subunit ScpB [Candidatus Woesearchaeota archaeon]MDP7467182.1 SMC-Scp complex subunit ScpB [Candidatus Woesearchaeota archaeon]MDP7647483.1 SMC-Scp complex subunit ScpB [Candidatus Woesearchaeota archaeon]